jgi:hypothetical protein
VRPAAFSSSKTSASNVPDTSAVLTPHSIRPARNPQNEGKITHSRKPSPRTSCAANSSQRREKRSASSPVGISSTSPVPDHAASARPISAGDSPRSANITV